MGKREMDRMSELSDLTALPNSTAFPGWTMSPLGITDIAAAEEQAASDYLNRIHRLTMLYPPEQVTAYQQQAANNLLTGFAFGWPRFNSWAFSLGALPFLLWRTLLEKHPKVTLAEAANVLGKKPTNAQRDAIYFIWGLLLPPSAKKNGGEVSTNVPQTGGESSDTSANPTPKATDTPPPR